MNDDIDNSEINEILDILENIEDEEVAASMLAELNEATRYHGKLIMNRDPQLSHEDWKKQCDEAAKEVKNIVDRIFAYRL